MGLTETEFAAALSNCDLLTSTGVEATAPTVSLLAHAIQAVGQHGGAIELVASFDRRYAFHAQCKRGTWTINARQPNHRAEPLRTIAQGAVTAAMSDWVQSWRTALLLDLREAQDLGVRQNAVS